MVDILKHFADIFLNKYILFYISLIIFFLPFLYRIRFYIETKNNLKLRKDLLLSLCEHGKNWTEDNIPELSSINECINPFEIVNIVSNKLFSINLFDNNEPADNSGFIDCKIISLYKINHYLSLYNKSLFSGIWSLILTPIALQTDNHFKLYVCKNIKEEQRKLILIVKHENDYLKIYKFIISIK